MILHCSSSYYHPCHDMKKFCFWRRFTININISISTAARYDILFSTLDGMNADLGGVWNLGHTNDRASTITFIRWWSWSWSRSSEKMEGIRSSVEAIINSPSVDTSSAAVTVFVLVLVYVSASLDLILNFIPVTPELELTILILFPILTVTLSSPLSSLSLSLSPAMHTERTSSSSQLPALIFLPTFGLLLLLLLLCNDEEGVACPLKEKKRELCQYYTSFLEKMRTYVWYPLSFSDDIQLRIQDESTIVAWYKYFNWNVCFAFDIYGSRRCSLMTLHLFLWTVSTS